MEGNRSVGDLYSSMLLVVIALVWLAIDPALAQQQGSLKVCKQGVADDWVDPEVWRQAIIIPRGAVFHDVGPIDGPVSTDEWWRLRVETLAGGTIRTQERCITLPAKISAIVDDWGRRREAKPRVTRVSPQDRRLFEIERFALPNERRVMAPWANVVPVEATVESAMGR